MITGNYAVELAKLVFNLESKRKQLFYDKHSKRLCFCRKEILLNYLRIAQLLSTRLVARIIKYVDDKNNNINTNISDLKDWFNQNAFDNLFKEDMISNKMILLFKEIQKPIDDKFFARFEQRFVGLFRQGGDISETQLADTLSVLFDKIEKWLELVILNSIAIKIDCNSLKSAILADNGLEVRDFCIEKGKADCDHCQNYKHCVSINCVLHEKIVNHEEVHSYIIPELMEDGWLLGFFGLLTKYHRDSKDIGVVIDMKLLEDNEFALLRRAQIEELIAYLQDNFKVITLRNWTGMQNNITWFDTVFMNKGILLD